MNTNFSVPVEFNESRGFACERPEPRHCPGCGSAINGGTAACASCWGDVAAWLNVVDADWPPTGKAEEEYWAEVMGDRFDAETLADAAMADTPF